MKSIFQISAFLFLLILSNVSFSQGNNLEFNRVIYETISGVATSNTPSVINTKNLTVPANKIWKLENTTVNFQLGSVGYYSCYLDGLLLNAYNPIYLPSGSYTLQLVGWVSSGTGNGGGYISGIEYNIVP
jgi:hypothetical protein